MKRVLLDTGPLVAILSARDQYHHKCVEALHNLPGPLFSCWPVMTEAAWLLRRDPGAVQKLLAGVVSGFLEWLPLAGTEAAGIGEIMEKYSAIHPQLADATLVYLAKRDHIDTIFTLDRRDFSVYRIAGRAFRILPA